MENFTEYEYRIYSFLANWSNTNIENIHNWKIKYSYCQKPNSTSIQPKVGLDVKMTLHTHHPPTRKLNVSNISAVTEPILTKL